FARKVAQLVDIQSARSADGTTRTYVVRGQLFFASADTFSAALDFREVVEKVRIDVSQAHLWDLTSITALDRAVLKFRREGTTVEIIGMNEASKTLVDRLGIHDKPGAMDQVAAH
ncbi:MAG TPA: STAS domain-containing protein, partial [Candidatus Synoicihabitans sp.]|nr:STAS domain-containing protein [Candidatus Synoicihabitans sp.]